jgi:hypothetical protein
VVPLDPYVLLRGMSLAGIAQPVVDAINPQIILGSIVTRCPSLSLAPSALLQLDSACTLFSKAACGFRAEKVLVCTSVVPE